MLVALPVYVYDTSIQGGHTSGWERHFYLSGEALISVTVIPALRDLRLYVRLRPNDDVVKIAPTKMHYNNVMPAVLLVHC